MLARLLALLLLASCRPAMPDAPRVPAEETGFSAPEATSEPAGLADDGPAPFELLPGDIVSLRVVSLDTVETPGLTVDETGALDVPLAGSVGVAGRTPSGAAAEIEIALHRFDRLARAVVVVTDPAGHRATVSGAVEKPGVVPIRQGARIAELLAASGGPKVRELDGRAVELGDLDGGRLIRDGRSVPVSLKRAMQGDPRHNIRARSGDLVWIPAARATEIVVLGDVRSPRSVPFHDGIRLTKALALAGGTTREADEGDVRIVRGPLSAPRVYRASLRALVSGQGTDVELRPGDVVYVSEHWFAATTEVVSKLSPLLVAATVGASLAR